LIGRAPSLKLASASGNYVLDPPAIPSVGQCNEKPLLRSKNIHWSSVYLPRLSTYVCKNPETERSGGESTRDPVRNFVTAKLKAATHVLRNRIKRMGASTSTKKRDDRYANLMVAATLIADSRTPLCLACRLGCRGRRLSRGKIANGICDR